MELTDKQAQVILLESEKLINKKREPDFTCVDFVRQVYKKARIEIPLIGPNKTPEKFNINESQLQNPPLGRLVFMKKKVTSKSRYWTHVGIIFTRTQLIHCSNMFGKKVCITELEEIWKHYDFVM